MFNRIRRWFAIATLAIAANGALAQDFPNRPVKILVPQTPGGASDALARIIAQKLSDKWGQPLWSRTAQARAATWAWKWWRTRLLTATRCS
jgi:tripartite-type tricarboxylate transporter receptor subunit TctC